MNLRHLKIFVTVAECGKMRMAADKLHITQPSVSQAIKELESYYGIKLFDRLAQRIYITQTGKQLLPYARHIVDSYESLEEYAFDVAKKERIRVGGSVSVGTVLLPKILHELERQVKGVDFKVTVDNTTLVEKMVLNSEVDIAIVEGIVESEDLVQLDIMEDELILVVGKNHPFYHHPQIQLENLQGMNLISRESGSAERNQFEHYLAANDINMVSKWSCSNTETIKHAVESGEGIAILSKLLVEKELQDETFHIVNVKDVRIKRNLKLIYHKDKFFSPSMKAFLDICTDGRTLH